MFQGIFYTEIYFEISQRAPPKITKICVLSPYKKRDARNNSGFFDMLLFCKVSWKKLSNQKRHTAFPRLNLGR